MKTSPRQLRQRMTRAGIAVALVVLTGIAGASWVVRSIDIRHQALAYEAAADVADIDALATAFEARAAASRGYLLSGDSAFLEARRTAIQTFGVHYEALKKRHATGNFADNLRKLEPTWQRLNTLSEQAMAKRRTDHAVALELWNAELRPLQGTLSTEISRMVVQQHARFESARQQLDDVTFGGKIALLGLGVIVVVILFGLLQLLFVTSQQIALGERGEQERTMFQLMEQLPIGIFVVDPKGAPYYANAWARRVLGTTPDKSMNVQQVIAASSAFEAGTDNPYPVDRAPIVRALKGERSEVTDMELRRGGEPVLLHVQGAPIRDDAGEITYGVAAFQDVRALHEAATRDPLTGLGNRLTLTQAFVRERLLSERTESPLAVAMLDIDHFKRVNDVHGHPVGDVVLQRLSAKLVETLRRTDSIGRWGGEEFVVLMPTTDMQGARVSLNKALEVVSGEYFSGANHVKFRVTFSAGVVIATRGESLESAVARADALLYKAKQAGRNRVLCDGDAGAVSLSPPNG